jgi:hypothetical protein
MSFKNLKIVSPATFVNKYSWDQQIHNKLQEIHYSLVGKTPCSYGQNPKEQVDLTRCRIGHSRLRHSIRNRTIRYRIIQCDLGFLVDNDENLQK